METGQIINRIEKGEFDRKFLDIYIDKNKLEYQKARYIRAIKKFEENYGSGTMSIFSAPGRSEIGGNHTDHQHGEGSCSIMKIRKYGGIQVV